MKKYTPLRYPLLEQEKEIKKLKEIIHKLKIENNKFKAENKTLKKENEESKDKNKCEQSPFIREDFENWRRIIRDNLN
jgi:regulator of replication initiation timing